MNFYEMEFLAKERARRIEKELRAIRLMEALRSAGPSWRKKWTLRLADFLIGAGLHLKSYYRTSCCKQSCP